MSEPRRRARTRVVLDTNALISALFWDGAESKVVALAEAKVIHGYTSPVILSELYEVLTSEKFDFTHDEADLALTYHTLILETVIPKERIRLVADDPDDDRVLECAREARAQYIISGDKHLLGLAKFGRARIIRAGEFLRHMADV